MVFGEWDSCYQWCLKNGQPANPGSYPPRSDFAPYYLIDMIKTTQERAEGRGITVVLKPICKVIGVEAGNKYTFIVSYEELITSSLASIKNINAVFLCTGAASNDASTYSHLSFTSHYLGSPWPATKLACISNENSVAVLGNGLLMLHQIY